MSETGDETTEVLDTVKEFLIMQELSILTSSRKIRTNKA